MLSLALTLCCCLCMTVLQDFSSVAEKTGTYTAFDYADIMEHLSKRWKLADRSDLTGEVSITHMRPQHQHKAAEIGRTSCTYGCMQHVLCRAPIQMLTLLLQPPACHLSWCP